MAWKKEYSKRLETQWGFGSNSNGIGTYIRLTKEKNGYLVMFPEKLVVPHHGFNKVTF